MKKIQFAIVGFGNIGKVHALAAYDANIKRQLGFKLRLKSVVTRRSDAVFLPGVQVTSDLQSVLNDPDIDFISVCTPNQLHLDYVDQITRSGKAVYCEKPLASTLDEAHKMVAFVRERKSVNGVALMYRQMPAVQFINHFLRSNSIGDIIEFKAKTYHRSYLSPEKQHVWRTKADAGGGALLDLGIHLIDLCLYLFGSNPSINGTADRFFNEYTEVDEIACVQLEYSNRTKGSVEVSRIFAEHDQRDLLEIYGTAGSLKIDFKDPYTVHHHDFESGNSTFIDVEKRMMDTCHFPGKRSSLGYFQDSHTAALIDFATVLVKNEPKRLGADFVDAYQAQKIIEEVYRSSQRKEHQNV